MEIDVCEQFAHAVYRAGEEEAVLVVPSISRVKPRNV
jgi:hypothetical protein